MSSCPYMGVCREWKTDHVVSETCMFFHDPNNIDLVHCCKQQCFICTAITDAYSQFGHRSENVHGLLVMNPKRTTLVTYLEEASEHKIVVGSSFCNINLFNLDIKVHAYTYNNHPMIPRPIRILDAKYSTDPVRAIPAIGVYTIETNDYLFDERCAASFLHSQEQKYHFANSFDEFIHDAYFTTCEIKPDGSSFDIYNLRDALYGESNEYRSANSW